MRKIALSKVKDDLPHFLKLAEAEEIVITRHGKPAAVLIGFKSEDDWFDYRLENDPRFLRRVEQARGAFEEAAASAWRKWGSRVNEEARPAVEKNMVCLRLPTEVSGR